MAGATAALRAEDYAISSFAGTGSVAGSADGQPGTFNNPYGVAIDAAKNLYVTDTVNHTIRKITPGRVVSTLAGAAGIFGSTDGAGNAARFNFPVGVAVDSGGNVYVSDSKNFTIRKITPAGVVSTFAGGAFLIGSTDGPGASARFFLPYGLAVDSSGTVYVAEGGNHLIRKITADGTVSTLAGAALIPGTTNGNGTAARFNTPFGLAVDGAGNVYVADSGNHVIRKVTAAGVVTTFAGVAGDAGAADGPSTVARFNQPRGVSVDAAGNLFVADYGNSTLRQISPAGNVTTIAGAAGFFGGTDSVGAAARFYDLTGVASDGTTVYVADTSNNLIRRGVPASAAGLPVISVNPFDQEVSLGQSVTFRVVVGGTVQSYQWLKSSVAIAGATGATFTIPSAQQADVATYAVRVTGAGGSIDSSVATLTVTPVGTGPIQITARPISQNVNAGQSATFSITAAGAGLTYQWQKNGVNIAGATTANYVIASAQTGDAATYLVRVTSGASIETATAKLSVGGISGGVSISSQPSSQTIPVGQTATFTVEAFGSNLTYQWFKNSTTITGATAATYRILAVQAGDAGSYTVRITGTTGSVDSSAAVLTVGNPGPGPGPGPSDPISRLVNLSILTTVSSAGDSFTMGYVVGGAGTSGTKPILIRAAGPTLGAAPFNIPGALADPKLETFAGQTKTGENDNWGGTPALTTAFASVGAFAYFSPTSLDAAVLGNIAAGDNSVRVAATGSGTGTVIAELYDSTSSTAMTASTPRLVNVSVLKALGTGLTAGFVIDGTGAKKVLIRAVGPTIGAAPFNVPGAVADPQLQLFSGQSVIGANDNWGGTAELTAAFTQVGAFALPAASRDAALLATLQPGSYTVQVNGVGGTTGVAIVEVYEVP
ncbi:immunoglobulin domain-containing protein [Horticoccus sp. 23ND18S-11]|uniref:immunoglobulin domain-containing protein n=1 Tax=Horticoccus sp. 23ND18S-11 TaxID=3391832 RepID=UPI0039C90167